MYLQSFSILYFFFHPPTPLGHAMPTPIGACIFLCGKVSFAKFLFLPSQFVKLLEDNFLLFCQNYRNDKLEQLQQFGKPTWHPYTFGKTRKIGLQQFGKPTW
jgi:hypothetical protein